MYKKLLPIKIPFRAAFWDYKARKPGEEGEYFIFREQWKIMLLVIVSLTFIPLIGGVSIYYRTAQERAVEELMHEAVFFSQEAALDVSVFLKQFEYALNFVVDSHGYQELTQHSTLDNVLHNLQKTYGDFVGLDIIDEQGNIVATSGEKIDSKGIDLQGWLVNLREKGRLVNEFFSEKEHKPFVFLGIREVMANGSMYFVRATLDNGRLMLLLNKLRLAGLDDIYLTNGVGSILTPSRYFGAPGGRAYRVNQDQVIYKPEILKEPAVFLIDNPQTEQQGRIRMWLSETDRPEKNSLILSTAPTEGTSLLINVILSASNLDRFMQRSNEYILNLVVPGFILLFLIKCCIVSYVIHRLYLAEIRKNEFVSQIEQADKLVSIGRLAAGVAHEVNNPLAIINEKAGLLQDLFTFTGEYQHDERLIRTVASIIKAVERAGAITHRLLGFSRQMDTSVQKLDMEHLILEVLDFVRKKAEYRGIRITVDVQDNLPEIVTDRGKMQQVLLNLVNNAFDAMDDSGQLIVTSHRKGPDSLFISVQDTGCGIPTENFKLIFEPFFSSKIKTGGTGLGLAIVYGLVLDLGGIINVESTVGVGTKFTVTLPIHYTKTEV